MKKIAGLLCCSILLSNAFFVQARENERPAAPGPDYRWEESYVAGETVVAPGFWRPKTKGGFVWVPGNMNQEQQYISGHWKPVKVVKKNKVWIPGFRSGGRWHPGRWRETQRKGLVWSPGHWNRSGIWIHGHWRPATAAPKGKVWVPGHWNRKGVWAPGHWRLKAKTNQIWIKGYYKKDGIWVIGRWKAVPAGKLWVPGHFSRHGVWVTGHWKVKKMKQPRKPRRPRRGGGPRR